MSFQPKSMGDETQKKLSDFLTEFEEDINSRIEAPETLMALMLYRSMGERDRKHLKDDVESGERPSASSIADILEKLSWSIQGLSRQEAVNALRRVPGGSRLISENRGLNQNAEE